MKNIEKLVAAFALPAQGVEDMLWDLFTLRSVLEAVGAQLDVIGKIVGQPRNGLDDDLYRRYILARISVNRSRGVASDLIRITRLVLTGIDDAIIEVESQPIATVVVRITGAILEQEVVDLLFSFLRDAVAGGVRLIVESETGDPATMFTCQICTFNVDTLYIGGSSFYATDLAPGFPSTGYITIDFDGVDAETVPYSYAAGTFTLTGGTTFANDHDPEVPCVLTDASGNDLSPGLGWGDDNDPDVGGVFASATA